MKIQRNLTVVEDKKARGTLRRGGNILHCFSASNNFVFNSGAGQIFYAMNTIPIRIPVRIGWVEVT